MRPDETHSHRHQLTLLRRSLDRASCRSHNILPTRRHTLAEPRRRTRCTARTSSSRSRTRMTKRTRIASCLIAQLHRRRYARDHCKAMTTILRRTRASSDKLNSSITTTNSNSNSNNSNTNSNNSNNINNLNNLNNLCHLVASRRTMRSIRRGFVRCSSTTTGSCRSNHVRSTRTTSSTRAISRPTSITSNMPFKPALCFKSGRHAPPIKPTRRRLSMVRGVEPRVLLARSLTHSLTHSRHHPAQQISRLVVHLAAVQQARSTSLELERRDS